MLILFINTSTQNQEIALFSDTKKLHYKTWKASRNESEKLLDYIEKLLTDIQKDFSSPTHILTIIGPGGFTSTRVGVTISNTLAYSLEIPLHGINLFDWWKIITNTPQSSFHILHSITRNAFLHRKIDDNNSTEIDEIQTQEFFEKHKTPSLYIGDLREDHETILQQKSWKKLETNIENCIPHLTDFPWDSSSPLEPFYGRNAV